MSEEYENEYEGIGVVHKTELVINNYDIYLDDDIEEPSTYRGICRALADAEAHESVTLHINSNGGYLSSAILLVNAISQCEAMVQGILEGSACSAGSMILLACDEIIIQPFTEIMIHDADYSYGGKGGGEVFPFAMHSKKCVSEFYKDIYSGFLTQKEIREVLIGKDLWFGAEESRKRVEKLMQYREKLREE